MRGAALWLAMVIVASPLGAAPARSADGDLRDRTAGVAAAVDDGPAGADSTAAATVHAPREEPGGPDVRAVRSGGVAEFLDARPLTRLVGSGGLGHRASLARGTLPAGMSAVVVDGRRVDDRLGGGLAILSARSLPDGTLVVPSGPDLSLLPIRTASIVDWPIGLAARGAGPHLSAVALRPGRLPASTPWARVSMGRGGLDWTSTAIEFGRGYREGRFGLSGFLELEGADAPAPGDSHEADHLGGRVAFELKSGWHAEIAARRSSLDRSEPAGTASLASGRVRSDVRLEFSDARSRFKIFHAGAWIRSGPAGGERPSAATTTDGLSATIVVDRPPLDAVRVEVAHVAAEGSLLADEERAFAFTGLAFGRLPLAVGSLALSVGGDWLDGSAVPIAAAALSGGAVRAPWRLSAEVGGRHPTATERLAAPLDVPGYATEAVALRGNDGLEPELALVVRADYARLDLLSGVGVRGELARVRGPLVIERQAGRAARPVNGDDEVAAAASLWAAAGDSLGVGARAVVDVFWAEDDGALASLAPMPRSSLTASAWVTSRFFDEGFLEVRWELSLAHDVGLSRGPWDGLIDDGVTSLDARAAAQAGPVRAFIEVRDLFDAGGARVPDRPLEGRRLAAGFSTSLWN